MADMMALFDRLLLCIARSRRRTALRDIACNPHLLADIGLTRDEVLDLANEPFLALNETASSAPPPLGYWSQLK
jgi:uncharacterized protein YjiS (DUF1127 family)